VPPRVDRQRLYNLGLVTPDQYVEVSCCRECNCALNSRALWTLTERRRFIAKWLRRRYRKVLASDPWSDQEISQLGPGLQRFVLHHAAIRDLVVERVKRASR
jgi:hypothetical protein